MTDTNNPPQVQIGVTRELAEFIVHNCEQNMLLALNAMQVMEHRDLLQRLVDFNEKFRAVKAATEKALKDD